MSLQKCYRDAEIVEGIGDAVGESAHDEERNRKQEREIVLLPGKLHGSRHHESATDPKESAAPRTGLQTEFEDVLSRTLDVHRRHTGEHGGTKAAEDVSQQDNAQHPHLTLADEACCARVKAEFISHDREKPETEEYGTYNRAIRFTLNAGSKKAESGKANRYSRKYRGADQFSHI